MIKRRKKGKEGYITTYAFWLFKRRWFVAISESKWHAGDKFKKAPIWFSVIGKDIPSVFIGKIAIGFQKESKIKL